MRGRSRPVGLRTSVALLTATVLAFAPLTVAGVSFGTSAAVAAAPAAVAPLAVPPATGNNAVITVKVGGDRTSASAIGNLAGVTLGLFTSATATTPVAGFGTCVSDADGDCSFTVPNTQAGGANRDRQLYVKQVSSASGFYSNPTLGTGSPVASSSYAILTAPQLRSGTTYRSTADFMIATGSTNDAASGGIWQSSRVNPSLPAQCGITVGLVLDLSNSVTDAQLVQLKAAANGFVDALTGTPSRVGTFTFATSAPASAGDTLVPTSVSTAGGAATVKSVITGYAKPGGNAGGTNWDRGIAQVALSTSTFDVAVVITDGNPTFYGNGEGPGSRTRFREVENGVFSANGLKALGTRVVAFGVGDGSSNAASGLNLRAISGTTLGSDYYQSADYAQAGAQLRALALGSCAGSVTVVKQVVPSTAPAGSTAGAVPQGGWTFGAAGSTGVAVDAPTSRVTASDGTGAANFPLTFSGGTTSGPVTLTETQQAGYTLQQVGGFNAVCSRIDTGASVPVTNVGATGFTVAASSSFPVSCVVYNRAPVPLASVVLHKQWVVNGTTYADGQQPPILVASGTIDGVLAPWEQEQTGYREGDAVSLDESTDLTAVPLCTLDSARLTEVRGDPVDLPLPARETLDEGTNDFTITNTLTCETRLALTKTVQGGDADPADWTLTATAPAGADDGPSGPSGVNGIVTPSATYTLAEDDPHPEYLQFTDPSAVLIPGSSGSWNCQEVAADGTTVIPGFQDGLNGGVTVPFGTYVRCAAVNRAATLVLAKAVENTHGGTAVPGDWSLTATPVGTFPDGLAPQTVTGSTEGASFTVRPGVSYTLTESGAPSGYELVSVQCAVVPGGQDVRTITLAPLDTGTCTFTNVDTPAELTLVKTVTNDEGGDAEPADWTLSADGPTPVSGASGSDGVTAVEVSAGTYTLSESGGPAGYTAGAWSCTAGTLSGASLTLDVGQSATCTIDNDDQPATLTLVKVVDAGETGADAEPSDWTLTATPSDIAGQDPVSGTGDPTAAGGVDEVSVFAGSYALSEDGPAGFDPGDWVCQGGVLDEDGSTVAVPSGGNVVCTITNTAISPTLTLVKDVVNDDGGTSEATAWTLLADGPTPISGATGTDPVTGAPVQVGTYDLSESGPAGYEASGWDCTGATSSTPGSVTLTQGEDATCTVTNDDVAPRLTLVKVVANANGGAAVPTDWTLAADGPTPVSGATGSTAVTDAAVEAGTYDLSESDGPAGYDPSAWVCAGATVEADAVTLGIGDEATCTITNSDLPALLTLVKSVSNTHGGTATPDAWVLTADGPTPVSGTTGSTAVTGAPVDAGTYDLTESGGPSGYDASDWTCTDDAGGTALPVTDGAVVLANGSAVTCTVVNSDILDSDVPASLTLVKAVAGEDAAAPTAWTLHAVGPRTISGVSGSPAVTGVVVAPGAYELSESDGPEGYDAGAWRCDGGTLDGSTVTLAEGTDVTCTITNTLPGSFDVAKTSDPTSGSTVEPGQTITYSVTVRKLAGVDPTDVVVDDDMSDVLTNATLVADSITASAGSAELSGTTLRWTIPVLQGTQTVTYQVVVASDAQDVSLTNVITSPGSETCAPAEDAGDSEAADAEDAASDASGAASAFALVTLAAPLAVTAAATDVELCSTTHRTPGPTPTTEPPSTTAPPASSAPPTSAGPLPRTGASVIGVSLAALAVLILGGALVLGSRRRDGDV